jgi:tetratricopeptide (TPR) repeat protein
LELIDVVTENVLWAYRYDRKETELVSLQSEIARDVSNKLRLKLSGAHQNQIAKSYTKNAEAYQLYLKGRFYWNKRTTADIKKSIEYFDQAIALDPKYALAYSGLADAWQVLPSFTSNPPAEEAYPKARAAAQKALEIDPDLAEPHAALGVVLHEYDWKFAEAENEFKKALDLDPNYASAHQWYGEYLKHMGRFDEAIAESKRAQELEPLSVIINMMSGRAYYAAHRYDDAIAQYQKAIEIDPNFQGALASLAEVYLVKGMFEEAIEIDRKLDLVAGVPSEVVEKRIKALRDAYRTAGVRGYWATNLQLAQDVSRKHNVELPPGVLAFVHMNMGDGEEALTFLEKTFENTRHDKTLISLKANPVWEPIRGEPRFRALLRKIGLPE